MKSFLRVIPWLEVKNSNIIKGINMEGLRTLGDPVKFAKSYYEQNADEIILYDVVASLYDQNLMLDLISKVSENIFIPLVVSGGIRNITDIRNVLRAGADRVCINSITFRDENFLRNAVKIFGSSTISVNLQIHKHSDGKYYCYYNNGREKTGKELNYWLNYLIDEGAGELIISNIDKDGSMEGIDKDLIGYLQPKKKIPIVLHGGCNGSENEVELNNSNITGLAIGSLFHYNLIKKKKFKKYKNNIGNFEYLNNFNSIYSTTLNKKYLTIGQFKNLMKRKFKIRLT